MAQEVKSDDVDGFRQELLAPFAKMKVSDFDLSQKPIVLNATLTPRQALEELVKNHLRCAPVIEGGKFIGVFDLRDAIKYAMEVYRSKHLKEKDIAAMEYIAVATHISTNTLGYLARMRKFCEVKETEPMLSVMKILATGSHIVGVLSSDGKKLKTILSQGQIFQQLAKGWSQVKLDVSVPTLRKLGYIKFPVVQIPSTTPAHEAFDLMAKHQLSGLAVVDEDGVLVHNTSVTDIKLWLKSSGSLEITIEDFLVQVRKEANATKTQVAVSSVDENAGLVKVINKLKATKYHRMWIVDDEHKPSGVFALTDLFAFMTDEKKNR